jgi:hypothetical protein
MMKHYTVNRNFQLSEEEGGLPACQGLREIFVISNSSDNRNWISPEGHLFSYKVSLKETGYQDQMSPKIFIFIKMQDTCKT